MSKQKQLTTTFTFDEDEMNRVAPQMTEAERERADRVARLIGPQAGMLLGSGLDLLMQAEGIEAARADVLAMIDSIDRLRRGV